MASKSQNACSSCRARKQRCDKALPACSRCTSSVPLRAIQYAENLNINTLARNLVHCDYSWTTPQSTSDQSQPPNSAPASSPIIRTCSVCIDLSTSTANALMQACCSDHNGPELAALTFEILQSVHATAIELLDDYCTNIHPYMPLLESNSLRHRLTSWHYRSEDNVALLVLAMILITRPPCTEGHSMNSLFYNTMKNSFMLSSFNHPSLETCQSGLLIAYYACGHAMPRDAHVVLASCLTVSRLMGIDFGNTVAVPDSQDQTSKFIWATLLLDRSVSCFCLTNIYTELNIA
jgi:hypothetical protein